MPTPTTVSYSVALLSSSQTGTIQYQNGLLFDSSYVWFGYNGGTNSIVQLNKNTLTITKVTTPISRLSSIYNDNLYYVASNYVKSLKTNSFTGTIQYDASNTSITTSSIAYYDGSYLWVNPSANSIVRYIMPTPNLSSAISPATSVSFPTGYPISNMQRLIGNSKYIWVMFSDATAQCYIYQILKSTATVINTIPIATTGGHGIYGYGGLCVDSSYVWVTSSYSISPPTISQILITDASVSSPLSVITCPYFNGQDISQQDSIYSDGEFVYVCTFTSSYVNVFKIGSPTTYLYSMNNSAFGSLSWSVIGDLNYLWQSNVNNNNSLINQTNIYGLKNVIMLDNSGAVWVAGFNRHGQLGIGNTTSINTLLVKPSLSITGNVIGFGGGMNTSYILSDDGTMYASGLNIGGSMLNSSGSDSNTFIQCSSLSGLLQGGEKITKSITNGVDNTCYAFLTSAGNVYSMGVGNRGNQFGNASVSSAPAVTNSGTFYQMTNTTGKTPVDIQVLINNVANNKTLYVLMSDGTLYGCGYNAFLGTGLTSGNTTTLTQLFTNSYTFPNLGATEKISQISTSSSHVLAITTLGNVYTLSTLIPSTTSGFTADSTATGYSTAVPQWVKVNVSAASAKFSAGFSIKRVVAGNQYSVVLFSDGALWGCGVNVHGQLGTGNYTSPISFSACLALPNGKLASAVQCLNMNTIVLASDGTVYACGFNDYGQLAQNNTTFRNSLVQMNATGNTPITNIKTLNTNYTPIVPGSPPSAPVITSIYSTDGSNQTIAFTQPTAAPAISYYLYSVGGGAYQTTAYSTSPFTISSVPGTSVTIEGTNSVGTSTASNSVTVGSPPTITGISLSFTSIIITFTAGASSGVPTFSSKQPSISGYKVSTDNGSTFQTCTVSPATVTGLTEGTNYNVLIQAYDPSSSLWYSYNTNNVKNITTYKTGNAPSNLIVSRIFNSETTLNVYFTDSSEGVPALTKYQYSLNGGGFLDATGTTSPITITTLTKGTSYSIVLKALSGSIWTSSSSIASASVSTNSIGSTPSALVLSPVYGSETTLTLSFTGSSNGIPSLSGYKYKLSTDASFTDASSSPIIITNLNPNTSYTVNLKAVSNSDWETSVSSATATTYQIGSIPYIVGIDSSINSIIVNFAQTSTGNATQKYYYSYSSDGSNRVAATLLTQSSFKIATTTPQTVYIIADSSAATLVSTSGVLGTPYVIGTAPVITNITPGLNTLTVTFNPSTGGNPSSPTYYYSYDSSGSPNYGPVTSPFDITNLSNAISYKIYIVSANTAGYAISDPSSATPYVIGNAPEITEVQPGIQSLTIKFKNSTNANPAPYYYYSYDGGITFANSTYNSNTVSISISNLDLYLKSYSIQLKGVSVQGNTNISTATGIPYLKGTTPNVLVSNGRGKITVGYSQDVSGTYDTTWYYYLNDISYNAPASPFDISGSLLLNTSPYSIYMLARNPAGDISSNDVSGNVFGSDPSFNVTNGTSKITVSYSQDISGTVPNKWYYYLNDISYSAPQTNPFDLSGSLLTSISPYSVYMLVNNPAGDLSTNIVRGNVLGSKPVITSITPGSNQVTVTYSQATAGTDTTAFYYNLSGSVYSASGGSVTVTGLTSLSAYSGYIYAVNPAGTINSDASSVVVKGSKPVITSITPGSNQVTVTYSQTTAGTDTTAFYYNLSGSVYSASGGSVTVTGLTSLSAYSGYIYAVNPAGTINSDASNVVVKGSKPVITSITPGSNQVIVTYSQTTAGTDTTAFYYNLSGTVYNASGGSVTVTGLTSLSAYSGYIYAVNPAGTINSDASSVVVKGSKPVITSITPGSNQVTVTYSQATAGTDTTTFYYNLSGSVYSASGGSVTVTGLTSLYAYSGYIYAVNPAGTINSDASSVVVKGSKPVITSITPGSNQVTVTYSQTTAGTDTTAFYYNLSGTVYNASGGSVTVTGLTSLSAYSGYIYAVNPAGTINSDASNVVVKGSKPVITSITPGSNQVTVTYSQTTAGTDTTTFYYNLSGSVYSASGGSVTVTGLTSLSAYSGYIYAVNPAGTINSDASNVVVKGSKPVITSITPGSNQVTVTYSQTTAGTDTTAFYYNLSGTVYSASGGSVTVTGLTSLSAYSGYIYAVNPAGTINSDASSVVVKGTTPFITQITPGINKLTVDFSQNIFGTSPTTYYYSANGSSLQGPITLPRFDISNITTTTTFYVVASNPAGNLVSADASGIPYVVGTTPTISSVTAISGSETTLKVYFAASTGGVPNLQKYQYSLNGGTFKDATGITSPITITDLSAGTPYSVTLQAVSVNASWTSATSTYAYVSTNRIGTKPSSLVAYSIDKSEKSLLLSFTDSSGGYPPLTKYQYTLDNGVTFNDVSGTHTPLTITDLSAGTQYSIRLKAVSDGAWESLSDVSGTATTNRVGSAPSYLVATAIDGSETALSVAFTNSSGGVPSNLTGYQYSLSGGVFTDISVNNPLIITGLDAGTYYNVVLRAVAGSAWTSLDSSASNSVFTNRIGSAPSNLSISPISGSETSIRVYFTGSTGGVPDVSGYRYSTNGTNYFVANVTDGSFVISGLTAGQNYTVQMVAYSGSAWTSAVATSSSVTTNVVGSTPSGLVLSAVYNSESSLQLSFIGSTGGNPPVSGYKYKLSTESTFSDASSSPIIITGLNPATSYNVNIKAVSNTDWESGVASATASTYKKGSTPTITADSSINTIVINFTQAIPGIPTPTYYYSESPSGTPRTAVTLLTASSFKISTTTPKTIYFIADSSSGTIISSSATGYPYVKGSTPVITSIVPGLNKLTVTFSDSSGGYGSPTYYYSDSSAGTPRTGPVTSPFDISGLSNNTPYTIYIVAANEAGNVISDSSSATPYVVGTTPAITSVTPGVRSLSINFNSSAGGYPIPYYYYSYDDGITFANSTYNSNSVPISISNLDLKSYSIQLKGVTTEAGNTEVSTAVGVPYVKGTNPNVSVSNGRGKITVGYSQDISGTYDTTWFYSLNGNALVSAPASNPFDLSGTQITGTSPYSIYMLARNPAGDISGNTIRGNVFGSDPSFNVTNGTGKITVSYSQDISGTDSTKWYYYLNDVSYSVPQTNPFDLSGALLTSISPYSVYMLVNNPAGDLSTNIVRGNVLGSKPTITSITPGSNQVIVTYSQTTAGTDTTAFYYNLSGSVYSASGGSVTVTGLTSLSAYSGYISAVNPAGTINSDASNVVVNGSKPVITSITPGSNQVTVTYSQTTAGTDTTAFYYNLSGTVYNASGGSVTVTGLTSLSAYSGYIYAVNPAGTIISDASSVVVKGSKPTITSITSGTNQATITYSQTTAGTDTTTFYYYLNDVSYAALASGFTIPGLNSTTPYTFRISAVNPAGTIDTDSSYINVFGIKPTATITAGIKTLTVTISQSPQGTSPTSYYYSYNSNGSSRIGPVTTPSFDISNITVAQTIYIVAANPAGNLVSDSSFTGTPYLVGSTPTIYSVTAVSGSETTLKVYFAASTGGVPNLQKYQYSLNGGSSFADASGIASPITITDLSAGTPYSLTLRAVSVNTSWISATSTYVDVSTNRIGTKPSSLVATAIDDSVTSLRIAFTNSLNGVPALTKYQYTLDNGLTFKDASGTSSPLIISDLSAGTQYSIRLKAISEGAWESLSDVSGTATTNRVGSAPSSLVATAVNGSETSVRVSFTDSSGGIPGVSGYKYSTNGVNYYIAVVTDGSFVINDLSAGTPVTVRLKAFSGTAWTSSETTAATITTNRVGNAPSNLVVTAINNSQTSLSVAFTDSSGGVPSTLTKYQYSLSGGAFTDISVNNPLIIEGLTPGFTYSVRLKAVAGSSWTSVASLDSSAVRIYKFGSTPTISSVSPVTGTETKLLVSFADSLEGYPALTKYQYSINAGDTFADASGSSSPLTIYDLSAGTPYSIILKAVSNSTWSSTSIAYSSVSTYKKGSAPVIGTVTAGINQLSVAFSQDVSGTSPTTFYYSTDGTTPIGTGVSVSPLIISNISTKTTFYIIANNPGGNVRSLLSASGTPYLVGSTPTISSVYSVNNSETTLQVYFTDSSGGYPALTKYQYALGNGQFLDASGTMSPLTIYDLSAGTPYLVRLKAVSGTAWTSGVADASMSVRTNKRGTAPYNLLVTPVTGTENQLSVAFTYNSDGVPDPTKYQYSLNGSANFIDVSVNNPIIISELIADTSYSVVLKAVSGTAWTSLASVASTYVKTYKVGNAPVIYDILPGINCLIVYFSVSSGGNPDSYTYYYSLNGGNYIIADSTTSPIIIQNLTALIPYTVTLVSRNSGGVSEPSNVLYGTPLYENIVPEVQFTSVAPPRVTNSISGSSVAQNRRAFVNITSSIPTTETERAELQKKTQTGVGKLSGDDVTRLKRIKAMGQTEFGKKK